MYKTLLVEDSIHFRLLLKESLKERFPSMIVEEATEGIEAMQKIDSLCPDLIFMDIRLPGENGLELTRKIKAKCPDVKVIILTSYDLPEYRQTAKQVGANHFIAKGSTTMDEILGMVSTISPADIGKPA
jgi:DNA-binding NarL/FixJ family response regulator